METKQIPIRNRWLLIFGIILLLIGLVASFYEKVDKYREASNLPIRVSRSYPYQPIGIVLVLAGIIFTAIGFIYSPRKRET